MVYTDDTYALYDELFHDAHQGLMKTAGVARWLGEKAQNVYRRGHSMFTNPKRIEGLRASEEQARVAAQNAAFEAQNAQLGQTLAEGAAKRQAKQHAVEKAQQEAARAAQATKHTNELAQLNATPGALTDAQRSAQNWRRFGTGAAVAGGVGVPAAYAMGNASGSEDAIRTRNLAFGAGAATGLAAPQLVRGLGHIARGVSNMNQGLYPESGYSDAYDPYAGGGY